MSLSAKKMTFVQVLSYFRFFEGLKLIKEQETTIRVNEEAFKFLADFAQMIQIFNAEWINAPALFCDDITGKPKYLVAGKIKIETYAPMKHEDFLAEI